MTVYVCPVCRYRRQAEERPTCGRPRHGDVGPVPMIDDGELGAAVRAGLIDPGARNVSEVLGVDPMELVAALAESMEAAP